MLWFCCNMQETVLALLFRGASLQVKDIRGTSVLLAAVQAGHKEVVELLIRNGAQLEMDPLMQVGLAFKPTLAWTLSYTESYTAGVIQS
jgi:hypothetical protein